MCDDTQPATFFTHSDRCSDTHAHTHTLPPHAAAAAASGAVSRFSTRELLRRHDLFL